MEHNRIQKLLLSEYCDFSDTVVVESPFAETTRDGRGIRQVALGLTSTSFIIATDILENDSPFYCAHNVDPSIETLELVSIFPLEFVSLTSFRRRRRRTLKARFIDGRARYYELGGMKYKAMFWRLWCEHINNLLARKRSKSSLSETTVASSTSTSTVYLFSSELKCPRSRKRICKLVSHHKGAGDGVHSLKWIQKDVYLGPLHNDLKADNYKPVGKNSTDISNKGLKQKLEDYSTLPYSNSKKSKHKVRNSINKFAINNCYELDEDNGCRVCNVEIEEPPVSEEDEEPKGVKGLPRKKWKSKYINSVDTNVLDKDQQVFENISANRLLQVPVPKHRNKRFVKRLPRFGKGIDENCISGLYLEAYEGDRLPSRKMMKMTKVSKLLDTCVSEWEFGSRQRKALNNNKHPRRYALAGVPHFFHGLGPWSVQPGDRDTVQIHRAISTVNIRRQPHEPEFKLPVSKKQLTTSISLTTLEQKKCASIGWSSSRAKVILFWTPDYWYRPRPASKAYKELRRHLTSLQTYRVEKEKDVKRNFFSKCKKTFGDGHEDKPNHFLNRIFTQKGPNKFSRKDYINLEKREEFATNQLRKFLKMDLRISAWDLDSTTLANQITLIDKDLFLRIPSIEVKVIIYQRSSRNAPNFGTWIAFSHRISCLIATEILATKEIEMRSRILARFINAADKCYKMGNFHSCKSILSGLQFPSIYRLKSTWTYLRIHHAIKYETMERLSKIYRNPKTKVYNQCWNHAEQKPPFLPYIGNILVRILAIDDFKSCICPKNNKQNAKVTVDSKVADKFVKFESIDRPPCISDKRNNKMKRFFSVALNKFHHKKLSDVGKESSEHLPWSSREQRIAEKYFDKWRDYVSQAKNVYENELQNATMDDRRRKSLEMIYWIADCQRHSQSYEFPKHTLAWEFLLKARYKEDRENFFVSLKLEPPKS